MADARSQWAIAKDACVHCGKEDYQTGFGPRTLLICHCCQAHGGHVECEEKQKNVKLEEHDVREELWFCSEVRLLASGFQKIGLHQFSFPKK